MACQVEAINLDVGSTSTRKGLFALLSEDLIIDIFRFLRPSEIVALRLTSKLFTAASSRRIVWLEALSRSIEEHGLFRPTYDLPSMTDAQLEYAALCPSKFVSMLKNSRRRPIMPHSQRILVNWRLVEDGVDASASAITDAGLVPGGRYLFTISESLEQFFVSLWDLGPPGLPSSSPFKVVAMLTVDSYIDLDSVSIVATSPTADGQGIKLVLVENSLNVNDKLVIHEVFPLHPTPSFNKVAELNTAGDVRWVSLYGDSVAFVLSGPHSLGVWDFGHNQRASLLMESGHQQIYWVLLYDDYLLAANATPSHSISLWKIPPLEDIDCIGGTPLPVPDAYPLIEIAIPFASSPSGGVLSDYGAWFSNTWCKPFLVATDATETECMTLIWRLEGTVQPGVQPTEIMPHSIPIVHTRSRLEGEMNRLSDWFKGISPTAPQFCDNTAMLARSAEGTCLVIMSPNLEKRSMDVPLVLSKLRIGDDAVFNSIDFSPVTGRFVVWDDESSEARIIDYLHPM